MIRHDSPSTRLHAAALVRSLPNPWRGLSGLRRSTWIVASAMFVNRAGTMVVPFLTIYVTRELGFSVRTAGLVLGVFGAASLVASPVAGRLCDRWSPRRVLVVTLASSGAVLFVFPLARSLPALLALAALLAVTGEGFRPASLAAIAEGVPPERRKAAFALARLAVNLGISIGPAAAGFLAAFSFRAIFWVDGATALLATVPLLVSRTTRRPTDEAAPSRMPAAGLRAAHRDPRLLVFLGGLLLVGVVFFQHGSTLALFMVRDLRLGEALYGLMFTLNTLIIVLVEVPLNLRWAHWPHRRTLTLGAALVACGFGALALVSGPWGIAATVVVWTVGEMLLLPGMSAHVADLAPPGRSGEYMGLYTMTFGVAFSLGPWLGTFLLDRFGPRVLWATMFAFGLASAAVMARLPEKAARKVTS